ncbi:MAG: Spy/CpxP family protein refolding chaperone [Gammaproteobacteria bacterium]|nr:Spy/CpxP family protein refolding chaperone [Gammaproteobacteria bacterium]MDH4313773.1 Spy/CpxP family protein refolding chaperone [Gammaproteobacteria bacterium]MDH5213493.1 Spy/CpxP family protein refolding chaperone [Gammaproteobacteria bacterium]
MKINKTALLALLTTSLLATSAYADFDGKKGSRDRHFDGPGFGLPNPAMITGRIAEHLGLDETQRESVDNIMSAAKPEMEALRDKARANHEVLRALDSGDPEVMNIAASNGELATEATLLFARVRGEIDAVLTDEQRAKLAEFKDRKSDRKERRQ